MERYLYENQDMAKSAGKKLADEGYEVGPYIEKYDLTDTEFTYKGRFKR